MDFTNEIKIFDDYIRKNYDFDNKLIKQKYIHTLNVVKVTLMLCEKLGLSKDGIVLAFYLALFHDLGRFREVVRQNEFNNLKFDHGAYSNKILFNDGFINNFKIDEKDYSLIKKAVYFHNKKDLIDNLTDRERLFCKILRDADRIDIFRVLAERKERTIIFDGISDEKLLRKFYTDESIDIKDLRTKGDRVLLRLSFIKLFSFQESSEVLKELGYFDEYLSTIEVLEEHKELFNELITEINKVLEGEKKYVREKVRPFNGWRE